MRGTILAFNFPNGDFRDGEGRISGDDGNRYRFAGEEWRGERRPAPNQPVDFEPAESDAVAVYPLRAASLAGRSRIAAALLALFLGWAGAHKLYLGRIGEGMVMLIISVFGFVLGGIPTLIMGIIGLVECAIYLTMNDEAFEETYVKSGKAWF